MKIGNFQPYFTSNENGQPSIVFTESESKLKSVNISIDYCIKAGGKSIHLSLENKCTPQYLENDQDNIYLFKDDSVQATVYIKPNGKHSGLFWRLKIANISSESLLINRINLIEDSELSLFENSLLTNIGFFSNGWQSWSHSGAYRRDDAMRRSRLVLLQNPMVVNPGTPLYRQRGKFSSDFFGVLADLDSRRGWIFGFLSQRQHFGTISADTRGAPRISMWANGDLARLDPQAEIYTDWAACFEINIDDPEPLMPYLSAVAQENNVGEIPEAISGWCSWYHYYQSVTAADIEKNLEVLKQNESNLPLTLVQIDDGFQKQVGDWFEFSKGFPEGVSPLAKEIKHKGYRPGLWLAPFIVHPKSDLYREHPEWLLRDYGGKPVNAGFGWGSLTAALDLTNPQALEYACKVVRTAVQEWGFSYIKLDFLYAAALPGKYTDDRLTRAQVMYQSMRALRNAAGDETYLLGCGLPLGSAIGIVDAMRIGADVSGTWTPQFKKFGFPFKSEPHMPSVRNAIQNTLTRAFMHDVWWVNDPDCLLVRPETELTDVELQSLASAIALTGGALLISDDVSKLPADRIKLTAALLPPIGKRAQVMDWIESTTPQYLRLDLNHCIGNWHLAAFFNWKDTPQKVSITPENFSLEDREYLVSSFWESNSWKRFIHTPLYQATLAPHACVVLKIQLPRPGSMYIGSNFHVSQGLEVKDWDDSLHALHIKLDIEHVAQGHIDLKLNTPPRSAVIQPDKKVTWQYILNGIYRFEFELNRQAELTIMM